MSGGPLVTVLSAPAAGHRFKGSTLLSDYWALTKPEVNFLILITTFTGFYLGGAHAGQQFSLLALFNTLFGTLLVASGTATLNQYIERNFDAEMRRTARRPAAAGRLRPHAVLVFGILLSAAGSVYLAAAAGVLASLLALLTLLSYLFLYTPLKRKTPLCVLVGAFPGAMPPLIGWAAASGGLNKEAWLLYALVFLWQFPHFMAIAWMYREDYDRAGYQMLPKGQGRVAHCDLANHVAAACFNSDQCHEFGVALRRCYLLGGTATWSSLPLRWIGILASAVEGSCAPPAPGFDTLPSTSVRAENHVPIVGTLVSKGTHI